MNDPGACKYIVYRMPDNRLKEAVVALPGVEIMADKRIREERDYVTTYFQNLLEIELGEKKIYLAQTE